LSFDLKIVSGGLVINNGELATVTGSDKLSQDLLKIAITEAGSNPLQPWYGSLVSRTLIGNYLSDDILLTIAKDQLQKAIENLKNLQNIQISSGQKMSPDEQIAFIKQVNVVRNATDPRVIQVFVRVLSRAFGQVSAVFTVP
jgi:hypothetical protein